MKASRKIMRIMVTEKARRGVDEVTARFGMTQLAAISRCLETVFEQPENVQSAILGISRDMPQKDISMAVLDRIVRGKKK
jgi:hypothetical protein